MSCRARTARIASHLQHFHDSGERLNPLAACCVLVAPVRSCQTLSRLIGFGQHDDAIQTAEGNLLGLGRVDHNAIGLCGVTGQGV